MKLVFLPGVDGTGYCLSRAIPSQRVAEVDGPHLLLLARPEAAASALRELVEGETLSWRAASSAL